jgi:hypothetical protein
VAAPPINVSRLPKISDDLQLPCRESSIRQFGAVTMTAYPGNPQTDDHLRLSTGPRPEPIIRLLSNYGIFIGERVIMMRVGVFSDDLGGPLAAIMLAQGFAALGGPVSVAASAPLRLPTFPDDASVASPLMATTLDEGQGAEWLDRTSALGRDAVVSLDLAALRDATVTERLDVSIVVGKEHPAAARALRAARCEPSRAAATPWFLAFSNQSVLRTEASLLPTGSIALPYATRALPTALPRLDRTAEDSLLRGGVPTECRRTGIMLAALATAAVAMPEAIRIEPRDLTALMEAAATAQSRLGRRLLRLAHAFEGLAPGGEAQMARPPRAILRRQDGQRWHPARAVMNPGNGRPSAAWVRRPV